MKNLIFLFLAFSVLLLSNSIYCQEKQDVVYLKNGSIVRGEIIEQIPNVSLKIKTKDGSLFVYKMEEIEKITKEKMLVSEDEEETQEEPTTKSKFTNEGFLSSFGSGISWPIIDGSFTDASIAFNIHANGSYLFNNSVAAGLDVQYNNFEGGDFIITSILANLKIGDFKKASKTNLYGTFGLGMYFLSASASSGGITVSISESNFGLRLGGGANFKVGKKVGIFGELSLDYNFNDGDAKGYLPIKVGIMFTP